METGDWHSLSPEQQKRWCEDEVEETLRQISAGDRDLDDWERTHLAQAVGFIALRWYSAAATSIHLAKHTEQKAPGEPRNPIDVPTQEIEDRLEFVRGMSAR